MSQLSRRPLLATLLAVAAMALSACAAGAYRPRPATMAPVVRTLPPPDDKAAARRQLQYYARKLADARRALGLDSSDAGPSVTPASPSGVGGAKAADAAPQPVAPVAKRSARAPARRSPSAGVSAEAARSDGGARYRRRCPLPCKRARAICHAARRICKLADYLAEDDARQRCDRAREDCRQARSATQSRCSACPANPA